MDTGWLTDIARRDVWLTVIGSVVSVDAAVAISAVFYRRALRDQRRQFELQYMIDHNRAVRKVEFDDKHRIKTVHVGVDDQATIALSDEKAGTSQ
jgi:hypothetical protein